MSAISKEKIKIRVLTKIQDIWTEWPDVTVTVTIDNYYFTVTVTIDNYKRIKDTKRKTKRNQFDVSGVSNNQNDDQYTHCK
jgi:E3 ubiquitin-protein ligase DOA10